MKLRNKLLALLLAVCLVGGLLPAAALASEELSNLEEEPVEDGAPAEEEAPVEEEAPAEDGDSASDADGDGYHDADMAAVRGILQSAGLWDSLDESDPAAWSCVSWSSDEPARVIWLDVGFSSLSGTLDVSGLPALEELDCCNTEISGLDVTQNPSLTWLSCYANAITELDLSKNPALTWLDCSYTGISQLDLSAASQLQTLMFEATQIVSMDMTDFANLERVRFGSENTAETTLKTDLGDVTLKQPEGGTIFADINLNEGSGDLSVVLDADASLTGFTGLPADADIDLENGTASFALTGNMTISAVIQFMEPNAAELAFLRDLLARGGMEEEYDPEDPDTWSFVIWTEIDGELRVEALYLNGWTDLTGALDVSVLEKLTTLSCVETGITALDVSKNTELELLECAFTGITELDVSKNTKLETLYCGNIGITALDVTHNPELRSLDVDSTGITALDISGNPKLEDLWISYTGISSLDTKDHPNLTIIRFGGSGAEEDVLTTGIGTMTLRQREGGSFMAHVNLETGECALIASPKDGYRPIDIEGMPEGAENHGTAFTFLWTGGDLVLAPVWEKDGRSYNQAELAFLRDLLARGGMEEEYDPEDPEAWDFVNWTEIDGELRADTLYLNGWTDLTGALDVSVLEKLTVLDCAETGITELDVSKNTELTDLDCEYTGITELDVSKNTELEFLHCDNTGITELDVSKNTKLTDLWCQNTGITELDVTHNPELQFLNVFGTRLSELDLSRNPRLWALYIELSDIPGMDMTGFAELEHFGFGSSVAEENVSRVGDAVLTLLQTEGGTLSLIVNDVLSDEPVIRLYWELEADYELVGVSGLPENAELLGEGAYYLFDWDGGDLTLSAEFRKVGGPNEGTTEPEPEPTAAPSATPAPEKSDVPDTGDDTPIALWAVLLLGCGAAAVPLVRRKKEN